MLLFDPQNFLPLRSSRGTLCVDRQVVRLQEDCPAGGRVPRTLDIELTEDLCDTCRPGDTVKVTITDNTSSLDYRYFDTIQIIGVVRASRAEDGVGKQNKNKSQYLVYLRALGVENTSRSAGSSGIQFTYNDYALVQEIHAHGRDIPRLLVASLAPSIFGHQLVKLALLLGLFGGREKGRGAGVAIRADPHILLVGDPGLGKSQMLVAASQAAPRAVLVTGNSTTSSGLTVSLTREAGNEFNLEAGALVLADRGCCCIDEFDKMVTQHAALLEAMEQQAVSVCKAGVVCQLPARTAVLAAANPAGGHYNRAKTVAENLKLGPALLSRFDLVFILIDEADDQHDCRLSEHVLGLHRRAGAARHGPAVGPEDTLTLAGRLGGEVSDPLPPQLLRRYIAYAREYVHPVVGQEAGAVLQEFYLGLRAQHQGGDTVPVTTRQLESLVRLTEARAKMELREEATEGDAQDVVEIMKVSLRQTH